MDRLSAIPSMIPWMPVLLLGCLATKVDAEPRPFGKFGRGKDAVPQDRITAIQRGRFGFLWLGTQRGLIRFDGQQSRWYRHDSEQPDSLSADDVQVLLEDRQGRFWIGTNAGLNLLDRRTGSVWRLPREGSSGLANQNIWSLADDGLGYLWIGTDLGLVQRHHERGDIRSIDGIDRVSALLATPRGDLFIGSDGQGLFFKAAGTQTLQAIEHVAAKSVLEMIQDGSGRLWIATTQGLFKLSIGANGDIGEASPAFSTPPLPDQGLGWWTALTLDEDGRVWAGSRRGLFLFEDDHYRVFRHDPGRSTSLSHDRIFALFADDEGLLWASTDAGGVDQRNLNDDNLGFQPLPGKEVQALVMDDENQLWIGTKRGGLTSRSHDDQPLEWTLTDEVIRSVLPARQGHLLVGTDRGLFKVVPERTQASQLWSDDRVWCVLEAENEDLYLGTDRGLVHLQPGNEPRLIAGNGGDSDLQLSHPIITDLAWGSAHQLWIGTFGGGLHVFDLKTRSLRTFRKDDQTTALTADDVVDVFVDSLGRIWAATLSGGLNRWDPARQTMMHLSTKQGFPENAVVCVLEDGQGRMWATTAIGLVGFEPDGSNQVLYNERDGHLIGAATPGSGFYHEASDTLYFGGTDGLIRVRPQHLPKPNRPRLVFTGLTKKGQDTLHLMLPEDTLALAPQDAPFSVDYAVLDFLSMGQHRYAYRRERVESDWVYTQTNSPITFAGYLQFGGNDRLLVQADSASIGTLNAGLNVTMAAPAWVKWLAPMLIGCIAGLTGLIYALISRLERRKRRKLEEKARLAEERQVLAEQQTQLAEERELIERDKRLRQETHALILQEHLEQVSTEVANSLHDGPLSLLQGLRFRLREAIGAGEPARDRLTTLTEQTLPDINKKLRHLCGQLLKPTLDHGLLTELEHLTESAQSLQPEWDLNSSFDPEVETLSPARKTTLIRIYRTLLHNVAKHAQAKQVHTYLAIEADQVVLRVIDNGTGFNPPASLQTFKERKHYGLYMVEYFTHSLDGCLALDSAPGSGTRVEVTFPMGPTIHGADQQHG